MLDRRTFSPMLTAAAATSVVGRSSKAQAPPAAAARNVVLVHGAYADGSCWSEVIGRLQLAGLKASAVQNPLTSLADDVAATRPHPGVAGRADGAGRPLLGGNRHQRDRG